MHQYVEGEIKGGHSLASMTWYGIDCVAEYFAEPQSLEALNVMFDFARSGGLRFRVLGEGANSLMPDGIVEGLIVRLRGPEFERVVLQGDILVCGAGAGLGKAIAVALRQGYSGLEWLAGVPASIGGATTCNAGGRRGDIGQLVEWTDVLDGEGRLHRLRRGDMTFGYRTSSLAGYIVIAVGLKLRAAERTEVRRRFIAALREKKASQPLAARSAGCAFKNPRGISARYLIADAELCGARIGGASVSELHPNFICAEATATSVDIRALIYTIRDKVLTKTGVLLEPEVHFW